MMILILALAALQPASNEAPEPYEVQGFRASVVVNIAAEPQVVFEAATGDITGWWDHSFALQPAELVIEPRFGGRFYERSSDGLDDGALHATVIYVDAPNALRLHGPLGLSGRAVDMVSSWTLEPRDGGTRFTVDLSINGEVDAQLAGVVRSVWVHFIEGRLKPYVEAGCHLAPDRSCPAFQP
ncbi:MAG: SRPBCC domain-containing protein [Pseudomonadota bacterium]